MCARVMVLPGFIGSTLVDRMLSEGHQVVGVDYLSTGSSTYLAHARKCNGRRPTRFSFVRADIQAPELAGIVAGTNPDMVFHLAAQVDLRSSVADPIGDARNNVLVRSICSKLAGVRASERIVYAASGASRYDEGYAPLMLGSGCASSPSGMPTSSPRWPARIWSRSRRAPRCCLASRQRPFLDIDSLLRPVYGHHKQGATFGHAKIAGRARPRKGLSPPVTTLSMPPATPVIAEAWLRSGNPGLRRGAARQVKQAISTTRGSGVSGTIMLRGDSAFGTKKIIAACLDDRSSSR